MEYLQRLQINKNTQTILWHQKFWKIQKAIPWIIFNTHNILSILIWLLGIIVVWIKYSDWREGGYSGWTQYEGRVVDVHSHHETAKKSVYVLFEPNNPQNVPSMPMRGTFIVFLPKPPSPLR